jgi:redox-sensitive bicupin YhaK (pirin superfamily)
MIQVRKSVDRGHFKHGWLNTFHTFSFGDYRDSEYMGFRKLRVINEDRLQPGKGFDKHSHSNMEIISYVIGGELMHGDTMGNELVIKAGDVQCMTAGRGVFHSEVNKSNHEEAHFLQIWIFPSENGLPPDYDQRAFSEDDKRDTLCLIVSGDGRNGSMKINQDVDLYASILSEGKSIVYEIDSGRHAWLQVIKGAVDLNGQTLKQGDGAAVSEERSLEIIADEEAEILLFDLA